MRQSLTVSVAGFAVILLVGCSSDDGLVLGTYGDREGSDAVELVGTLVAESGCVMIRSSEDEPIMLGWPDEYSLQEGGETVVLDGDGREVAAVGQTARLGGGPIPAGDLSDADGDPIPSDCRTGHAFAVSSVAT